MQKVQGIAALGGAEIVTSGTDSDTESIETFPGSTVSVYFAGTTSLVPIYSDEALTPQANPFSAGSDASWSFWVDAGVYDITFSGLGVSSPFSLSSVSVKDSLIPPAGAFYWVVNYPSFHEAVDQLGDTVPTTLIVSEQALVDKPSGTTVPPSMTLWFVGAGQLVVDAGVTLTIQGAILADPGQHIFNTSASGAEVSFTGNNVQKDYWVAWWGPVGDGVADDTAPVQAAFDAQPQGSTLHLGLTAKYRHTGLVYDHKGHTTLIGVDSDRAFPDSGFGPWFIYDGIDGGTALQFSNCYGITVRGFTSFGSDPALGISATGAAINLDSTFTSGGSPSLSSQNTWRAIISYSKNLRADYVALKIDNASKSNNEFHNILDCQFYGSEQAPLSTTGTGIYIGHINAKQIRIERTTVGSFAKAIHGANGGNFRGLSNTFDSDGVIYFGAFGDSTSAIGDDSENCTQIVSGSNQSALTIIGGRYDNVRGGNATDTATRSTAPVFNATNGDLNVTGCEIGVGGGNFSSNFADGHNQVSLLLQNNRIIDDGTNSSDPGFSSAFTRSQAFRQAMQTFRQAQVYDHLTFGLTLTSNPLYAEVNPAYTGLTTSASRRELIAVQIPVDTGTGSVVSGRNSITIGDQGQWEIAGLARPDRPFTTYVGSNDEGQNLNSLVVLARDASGNRTIVSEFNQNVKANTTLDSSHYVHVTWPRVSGGGANAADYLLLQFSGGVWRIIATVAASGTDVESYDIVANPAEPFTYTIPTYNETVANKQRGAMVLPVEKRFVDVDATPSVIGSSDFLTANTGAINITTFDDGIVGQIIRVRVDDANTTFVNGSGILTRTGANVVATNGLIYSFIKRGSNWYQL